MNKYLNEQGEFTIEYDDYVMPTIQKYEETVMFEELAE
jgi:hypothetical protein